MINRLKTCVVALAVSAVASVEASAFSWPPVTNPGGGGSVGAPELDASGGVAVLALLVSIALVLYSRSRNR